MEAQTAGIVVIGNEILSGKVVDENSPWMAKRLRELGLDLRRIVTVPDEVAEIAAAVATFARLFDIVLTSGGVGPTHDDVSMEGVAEAFHRTLVRHPELDAALRQHAGEHANEALLRMALIPDGAALIHGERVAFPTVVVENVYVLPGVPEILKRRFEVLAPRFSGVPFHLHVVYSRLFESAIAESLETTLAEFPGLLIGSYPRLGDVEVAVKVTVESRDADVAKRAFERLLELLPEGAIVRTE